MSEASALKAAPQPRRIAPFLTIAVLAALTAYLTWRGYSYYKLDAIERIQHPDYQNLKAAGLVGHGYGIVGTGLILTNLLYLPRRRLQKYFPAFLGSIKTWLNMHVVTGLGGAILILFHSAFQLRTPVTAAAAVSLGIVVVTGLVGLYFYALVPKSAQKALRERLDELRPLLPGFVEGIEACVKKVPCTQVPPDASLLRALFTLPAWMLQARARRRGVREAAHADKQFRVVARTDPRLAKALVAELSEILASEVDSIAGSSIIRTWRSLHRFLAILMIVTVIVHVGVAWFYGFRWIFST